MTRATKLFGAFVFIVALAWVLASTAGPRVFPNALDRALLALVQPAIAVGSLVHRLANSNQRGPVTAEEQDPVLFVHMILGVDALIGLLAFYFLVCVVAACCWTWIERKAPSQGTR